MAASEAVTESVEAVRFSFLTDEEVRKHSVVKITNPVLLDSVERPVPGGLYDPALGSLDERTPCKSCGQRQLNCPGHCGHIDLVSPIYNPLLFNILYSILKRTCFSCYHFRRNPVEVKKCVSQLELILKGDVARAKDLNSRPSSESSHLKDYGYRGSKDRSAKPSTQPKLTSLQLSEAMSVLNNFLKPNHTKCRNCEAHRLTITQPVFGWLNMERISGARARANVIRNSKLEGPFSDGESLPEEEIINDVTSPDSDADTDTPATSTKSHRSKGGKVPREYLKQTETFSGGPMLPSDVKEMIRLLWENEIELCTYITDIQHQGIGNKADHSMFFLETILVPPIKFRPPSKGGDSVMEHPHTVLLNKVLQANIELGNAHVNKLEYTKIVRRWMDLQQSVNVMFDSKTSTGQRNVAPGICQLLEKKEGIFRQKMMGKRVNFACRSVISPDPYLAVNEIGIPPYFALRLTYPERVTPWNVVKLRDAIINGPETHPGATHYVDKLSTVKLPLNRKARISASRKLPSSRGVVMQNGKTYDYESEGKIVHRHLQDGDIVLVNRQPTLHKPSIMAHVVRVLKGEKTIRMHYANCSTYNADFDGDEMNVHLPQDEISRAEGYNILNANNQYVKPTSGEPIRALIQDHIISAVLLTKKDTFLRWDEFNHLLYSTGLSNSGSGASSRKFGNKVFVSDFEAELKSLLPAIWKPEPLWTGKQVITALLNYITRGFQAFTVEKGGKIPRDFFRSRTVEDESSRKNAHKDDQDEEEKPSRRKADHIESKRKKEPITGRKIDKNELKMKEELDDKLFIYRNNFVRGVIDKAQFGDYGLIHTVHELYGSNTAGLLLSSLSRLFTVFLQMHGFTCGVDDLLIVKSKDKERGRVLEKCEDIGEEVHREFVGVKDDENIDPFTLQLKIEKTVRINGEAALASLDRKMISQVNDITSKSEELKGLLSKALLKPPIKNCISLMTTSGAKGGAVNFQQISSHLGQQELEGKRVPRMASGKTLPCFPAWDWRARAGGLVIDCFLSGLRPQEFYFHCMAGREGLVDTAVKTSRSGYLQRCLIKNLECLKVSYDHTVRDADGSIVQFCYGEDGVDVHQTSFLANFEALAANKQMIYKKCCRGIDKSSPYIKDLPSALEKKAMKFVNKLSAEKNLNDSSQGDFLKLMEHKYLSSLAQPGEPVGVLAAQSVGEPSTQMTLNTFHLAGRGEMNVTLGIPRLQEILMTAAIDIKTPVMTCPLQEGRSVEEAKRLAFKLKKVTVADIIETMKVTVEPFSLQNNQICRIYKLEMKLYRPDHYQEYAGISSEDCEEILSVDFLRALEDAIKNHLNLLDKINGIQNFTADSQSVAASDGDEDFSSSKAERDEEDDDGGDGDNEGQEDLGLDAVKQKRQATDEMDYDDDYDERVNEEATRAGSESEDDNDEDEVEFRKDNEVEMLDAKGGHLESPSKAEGFSTSESLKTKTKSRAKGKKKIRRQFNRKDDDRSIFVEAKGFYFKVHFRFSNEAHILLAQIAQNTATRVYIQSSGKVDNCQQITCKENQVIYYGKDPKSRDDIPLEEKENIPALQTSGVDFMTFWKLQDILDVRYIYSNDIHAMLNTYGVEAARETIIREITNVFKSYGISVNIRHLTLIADFMTHTGGYRSMSRHGGIADSISPFSKMCFETASKFIVEAAYHREMDDLETPSARICLGLPVKVGTGCFDLMQKLEI
ncbi:DNA-directed RNA polymerase I subunit 1 [Morus notabilis]|uniref:DNA-directed RNA polymerase I subunit 1 n=1 Tax=Morus notabilis TaxID=981085 RepID=UPI000CED1166|nr:DNA-directed RNA polymerase I subunit 1 [Morus notabilis]